MKAQLILDHIQTEQNKKITKERADYLNLFSEIIQNSMRFETSHSAMQGIPSNRWILMPFDIIYIEHTFHDAMTTHIAAKQTDDELILMAAYSSDADRAWLGNRIMTAKKREDGQWRADFKVKLIGGITANSIGWMDDTEVQMLITQFSMALHYATELKIESTTNKARSIAKESELALFEYTTLKIITNKTNAISIGQGGHHASPREHDRRAHLRKLASGKTVKVKSSIVGDSSKGIIHKDYQIAMPVS